MKRPELWRVDAPPETYAEIFDAARELGVRLGWLEIDTAVAVSTDLDTAAGQGALRAVAVVPGRAVAVKPMSGPPVLRDMLREHFLGCRAVLVRGEIDAGWLTRSDEGWRLGEAAACSAEQLLAGKRSARP